jgi:hypothetical protein
MPRKIPRVQLLLQHRQPLVQLIAVIHLMGRRSIIRRINIIQIRTKLGLRLRLDNSIVDAIHEVHGFRPKAVILKHLEVIAVVVGGEIGVFFVNVRGA